MRLKVVAGDGSGYNRAVSCVGIDPDINGGRRHVQPDLNTQSLYSLFFVFVFRTNCPDDSRERISYPFEQRSTAAIRLV